MRNRLPTYEASHELDKRGRRPPAALVQPPLGQRPPVVNPAPPNFHVRDKPGHGQHGPPPGGQFRGPPLINGFNPYLVPPYAGPPPGFVPGPILPPHPYSRAYPPLPGPYGPPPPGLLHQPPPPSTLAQNRPAHLPPRPLGPLPPGGGRGGRQRDTRQPPGPNSNTGGGLNYG